MSDENKLSLYPTIIAGGSGTRFWPLSRRARPKQFLPLASKNPLIVETAARVKGVSSPKQLLVVCGEAHARQVKAMLKGLPPGNVVVEPVAKNTAPAIALVTAHVAAKNPSGILLVLPADQHVADIARFREALDVAARVANSGQIVTIGIKPTRPETGYGYIRVGAARGDGAHSVEAFVEKPNIDKAQEYLTEGNYLWNAGIFVFRADVMLSAFQQHIPELSEHLSKIQASIGKKNYSAVLKKVFPKMPSISIDYAVAERATNIAVVPGDFGWSDVGSFNALPEVRDADENGNVVEGKGAVVINSEGCIVLAKEKPLAVVGMRDVVVVDAGDSILVLPREKSQDVRLVVESLKARKLEKFL